MPHRCVVALVFLVLQLQSGFAQPLQVNGINDRAYSSHVNSASFSVPTDPGHAYLVLVDGKAVPAGVTNRVIGADYHEILVWRTNVTTGEVTNRLVRFLIESSNRGSPERGLIEWTPYPQIPSATAEFAGAALHLMAPSEYPAGLEIPIIARVENPSGHARRVNGLLTIPPLTSFRLLRGHGSGFLPASAPGTSLEFSAQVGAVSALKEMNIDLATMWMTVSGTLNGAHNWPDNSRVHITGDVTVPAGSSLTIGAGTIVKINPLRNIHNRGVLTINGTTDRPVVLTATNRVAPLFFTHAWGGVVMDDRTGNRPRLIANGAIFVGGGGNANYRPNFPPGTESHRPEQPVLLCSSNSTAFLTNCAIINTAGQAGNGYFADVTFDHCLIQKAITAGEYAARTNIINHSAVIEFPEDNALVDPGIADFDYDALYFTRGTHLIYNSLIGFCKDDALDSGSGGAGTMLVTNCWIESALHEANAWSGQSRVAETYDSVLMNSGQGFECGWSTGNNSPLCYAGNILSIGNSVGVRFGDNYDWTYNGFARVTNSYVLHNYRDVWGLNWEPGTRGWIYRSNQMDIRSNFISQANAFHPSNSIWNGAQEGWRLAGFMTTPPNAPVGIGFATWTNRLQISTIFSGVPVRLSSFTTNPVSVDYVFQAGPLPPVSGTLVFSPGETVKRIFPYGFNVASYSNLRLILVNPVGGELTGNTNVQFQGTASDVVPGPVYGAESQHDHARLREGYPLSMPQPWGIPLTIGYAYDWTGGILRTGVITFTPGETIAWAAPPEGDLDGMDLVRFRLTSGGFPAAARAYYVKSSVNPTPPPTTIVALGSTWRYPNVAGELDASWKTDSFSDAGWRAGATELGFGDGDEVPPQLTRFAGQITYYFRKTVTVDDPAAFANLSLWMRRDDGAVMYFNGNEVFRSSNMPAFPAAITFTTEAVDQGDNFREEAVLTPAGLIAGNNLIAVEIHQDDPNSSDISFNMELTGNPAPPPPAPQKVYVGKFGNQMVFAWSDARFILEQADNLDGQWTTADTTSPFVIIPDPSVSQKFYRLINPNE